ncbi:T-cell activation inhibitor, mitochondrial-like [Daktulosphaira vitifoliae]|uniref:T-cell activation inhibitor, mitochondrial-like n=1 Tax=Daktulosphaira vitifoliae TaxID=58002 RepID=UPI0021AA3B7A|nr:T-cell activation inhibitor, mitochondrial-like [Daktulosphaira vitifoliae]XP_050527466.1 T-cell activation inhibitor, mitochondrial-like [Daktulosphaira vitifoliae]XP_050527467.1 T-cell activation inhibitor, mitochondrial-like [Daktulosphaira vitifoliae]
MMIYMKTARFIRNNYVCGCMLLQYRKVSSSELSTALRPFYFSVHPDLFGKFPNERATNECSLQMLSSFLETSRKNQPIKPVTVKFFLKPKNGTQNINELKTVKIYLNQNDLKQTVSTILQSCNLSTSYVDGWTSKKYLPNYDNRNLFTNKMPNYVYKNDFVWNNDPNLVNKVNKHIKQNQITNNLYKWLKINSKTAREKLFKYEPIRKEVSRIQTKLCKQLELKSIEFDCGWDIRHFIGCLVSFQTLLENHPSDMALLKGRTIMFGRDTGLSLDGIILLNSGEVRHNWLDFIKNVPKEDTILLTVPAFEKATSRVLRDIKVVRRKFQPRTIVKQYENNLRNLTTSLSDYQGRNSYPKVWPETLNIFELVVETEAGPLMVSPTGQFIVPASCPASLLVNFITNNLSSANELLKKYQREKYIEKDLFESCINELNLITMVKDDCITPSLMIECCQNLYNNRNKLRRIFSGMRLCITTYYSIMSDGQICIPWNWNTK